MLHQFYPDHEADSAYGIDYKTLYEKGYRGIIFDIDNTLVPHGAPATPQAIEFFGRLRELGFQTLLWVSFRYFSSMTSLSIGTQVKVSKCMN